MQQFLQTPLCIRMQKAFHSGCPSFIISERVSVCVRAAIIYFGRRHPIHKHFDHIAPRHRYRFHSRPGLCFIGTIVNPVFIVMFVPALMVQPCSRIACRLPFRIVRTSVSLVIFDSYQKLRRSIFGQVVQQSLTVQPYRKTAFQYQICMVCDCFKMSP